MTSNVVLIGMMGSGKTTVGRLVAERLSMEFIDLDQAIVDRAGRPIPVIFEMEGEDGFRQYETEALRELLSVNHAVIATGGGVVTRAENRALLRRLGKVFWLDAPPDVLYRRIGEDEGRPLLKGGDALKRLEALNAERREYYAEVSDIHLDTTEATPEELADRIAAEMDEVIEEREEDIFSTIVAIDGPVASGKSTLARRLAQRLGFTHVDTGAMYRCVTLEAMRRRVSFDDPEALTHVAHSVDIRFIQPEDAPEHAEKRVLLNGEDVTEAIRSPEVSRNTSPVADTPGVRGELVRLQREMALRGRSVLEGRDISTVVVPEARWKIFLVASLDERVRRRHAQYAEQGKLVDIEELRRDMVVRDERDRIRPQGGLKLASDAMILDSTDMPLEEVVETVAALVMSTLSGATESASKPS
ncbi:MAG: (d)CMP kinase [Candidatus Sumerlaeaceae bacterium]|nr:(d)CMP kinase [Candidatus Sumerlaeaceae bacterium]